MDYRRIQVARCTTLLHVLPASGWCGAVEVAVGGAGASSLARHMLQRGEGIRSPGTLLQQRFKFLLIKSAAA